MAFGLLSVNQTSCQDQLCVKLTIGGFKILLDLCFQKRFSALSVIYHVLIAM